MTCSGAGALEREVLAERARSPASGIPPVHEGARAGFGGLSLVIRLCHGLMMRLTAHMSKKGTFGMISKDDC